jgi:AraC-type transcriptional regulator N-terminus
MAYDHRRLPLEAIRDALAHTIARWTEGTEDRVTPIPNLAFFRRHALTPPGICQVEPSVVLVVQGAKRMLVGDDTFAYNSERFLIASLDIPASSEVVEASPDRPCLGLLLKLDLRLMTELLAQSRCRRRRIARWPRAWPSARSRQRCSSPSSG